jgi:hypothetical protein
MQFFGFVELLERAFTARTEKFKIETQFRAGRFAFELIQQRLVKVGEIANRVWTLVVNIINAAHQRIRRCLAFVKAAEGLDLFDQPFV